MEQSRFSRDIKMYFVMACFWTVVFVGGMEHVKRDWLERQPQTRALRAAQEADEQHSAVPRAKAQPIDISYVDVSQGHRQHPHRGAKDEEGNWGYRHDATALARNPPLLTRNMTQACTIHDSNYKMLHEKVSVDFQGHLQAGNRDRVMLMCIVYTTATSHAEKLPPIRETWGPRCDGFMVASTKTDRSLNAVEIPHEGDEKYENIWQKIRSVWSYVYDNYYNEYDWFHIGGEDMFVIPENLRLYLESPDIVAASQTQGNLQMPLFLGGRLAFEGDKDMIFNQGGGGYTLNKAALKALVTDGIPNYYTQSQTFTEDVMIAKVFKALGIFPYDTRDATGAERYHPYSPGFHYDFRQPHDESHNKMWYAAYIMDEKTLKEGVDHCNQHSVSFHYIKVDLMYRLYALLYHLCPDAQEDSHNVLTATRGSLGVANK